MTAKGTPSAQDGYKAHCKGMAEVERRNQMTKPEAASPAGGVLADRLNASLLRMANECSVDMTLWNEHSNLCLDAIKVLRTPAPPTEAIYKAAARIVELDDTADLVRLCDGFEIDGSNQYGQPTQSSDLKNALDDLRAALTAAAGEKEGDPIRDAEARGYREGQADAKGRG